MYQFPLDTGAKKNPFRLCPHAIAAPAKPQGSSPTDALERSLHGLQARTSRRAPNRLDRRCCIGTPEMEQMARFGLAAWTLATSRSTTELHLLVLRFRWPHQYGARIRGKFLTITHRRHSAGEFNAARSLRGQVHVLRKTKRPGTFQCPGLLKEIVEVRLHATSTRLPLILIRCEPQTGWCAHGPRALIRN